MKTLGVANRLLGKFGLKLSRSDVCADKPWDHTFIKGQEEERLGGDPNRVVWETWGRPDFLRYYEPFVTAGAVVCEIGPGVGRWTYPILDRVGRIYLVDYSRIVCKYWQSKKDSRIEVIHCGNTRLPSIPSSSVDLFFSIEVFAHLDFEDFYGYMQEAYRVLKPGCRAVIDYLSIANQETVDWLKQEIAKNDCFGQEMTRRLIFRFYDERTIRMLAEDLGFEFRNEVDKWFSHSICTLTKPKADRARDPKFTTER